MRRENHFPASGWAWLAIIFLLGVSTPMQAQLQLPEIETDLCLIELNTPAYTEAWEAVTFMEVAGGKVAVMGSPEWVMGWIPRSLEAELVADNRIQRILRTEQPLPPYNPEKSRSLGQYALTNYFNEVISGRWALRPQSAPPSQPFAPQGCIKPNPGQSHPGSLEKGTHCDHEANSEYMTGSVTISSFFVESDGTIDPNTYTWTPTQRSTIMNEITDAATIWSYTSGFYGVSSLTFNLVWYVGTQATQGYEPIIHASNQDSLWIKAIMGNLGYTANSYFSRVHDFNYAQKNTHSTQWAFTAFVGNNVSGPNTFTDGFSAYAWPGGPYAQFLYDNSGWGATGFHRVFGHETTHIFHAFDEYAASPASNCSVHFNGVTNTNYQGPPCNGTSSCIMIDNSYTGSGITRRWNLCSATPSHIGWANLTPAPTLNSPTNGTFLPAGTVNFSWNRNTTNTNIDSWIRILNLTNSSETCANRNTATTYSSNLAIGNYTWMVINGLDIWNAGWAQVEASPANALTIAPPDLTVGNLTVSHFPIVMGDTFIARMTVSNISPVTTTSYYAGVYLSIDAVWDPGDVFLGEVPMPALNSGSNTQASVSVSMPWSVACGSYFLLGVGDNHQQITEASEVNNVNGLLLPINPPPAPVIVLSDDTVCDGSAVQLTAVGARGIIKWYESSCGGTSVGTGTTIVVVPLGPTQYFVDADTLNCPTMCADAWVYTRPAPMAGFGYAINGYQVTFSDSSAGAVTWQWDFGDGNSSASPNPVHSYGNGGIYTVTQITTAANGCTDTLTRDIDLGPSARNTEGGIPGLTISAYPNPIPSGTAPGTSRISMTGNYRGALTFRLTDLAGRKLEELSWSKQEETLNFAVDLAGLPSGMYLVQLTTVQGIATLKWVKE